jgi:valyl-tRNA synthetase
MTEKRQTSQGYIIRILQHFATKLWNITNFVMLFQVVMKFLSRSKFSLLRKWQFPLLLCSWIRNDNCLQTF